MTEQEETYKASRDTNNQPNKTDSARMIHLLAQYCRSMSGDIYRR